MTEPGHLVAVTWTDAWMDWELELGTRWKRRNVWTTYGLWVRDDHDVLSVAGDVCQDKDSSLLRTVTHIPKGMVQDVTRVERVK